MTRWTVALGSVAAATLGLAIGLGWWAASLFHELDLFYRTSDPNRVYPDEVNAYYARIGSGSYTLQDVCTPLLQAFVLACLVLLGVLAMRWERRG